MNIRKIIQNIIKEVYERPLGKKLSDQTSQKYINMYRAVALGVEEFYDKDYVTPSLKFAVEHAENNAVYNEEQQQIIKLYVSADNLYEATNPGEYFYSGPTIKGRVNYKTLGYDYEGFEELTRADFLNEGKKVKNTSLIS